MIEVFAIVEGQTEETFVNEVLSEHLMPGVCLRPLLTGVGQKRRTRRGGIGFRYEETRRDVVRSLKQHAPRGSRVTTMLDLYGLPADFPGFADSVHLTDPYDRVAAIEQAMAEDIPDHRFIPYIQLHEFEALLLSSPEAISAYYPQHQQSIATLAHEVAEFPGPEWVDDGKTAAPSKRIEAAAPGYQKVLAASIIAMQIGLERMLGKCPHFAGWVGKLRALGGDDA